MATVLVAEDEPLVMELFQELLKLEGHDVLLAQNAHQAVALMRAGGIDLVVSDCMMPGDGMTVAREGKRLGVPVIIASGTVTPERTRLFEALGVRAVLVKPFQIAEFREVVRLVLGE